MYKDGFENSEAGQAILKHLPISGPMFVDYVFDGVTDDTILTVEELDKASGGATKLSGIDAVIKYEWQEEERRRFMTDLASAPIGSSKDEQRKRVATQIKIADEIGWGSVKIKSEKELGEILGPDDELQPAGLLERDHSM